MNDGNHDDAHPAASPSAWWRTVSAREVRAAGSCVEGFLAGDAVDTEEACERFARAVALQWLLEDEGALVRVAQRADGLVAGAGALPPSGLARDSAVRRAAHCKAILRGLDRAIELLRPRKDPAGVAHSLKFQLALAILEQQLIQAPFRDGVGAPVRAPTPFEYRRRPGKV